MNLMNYIKDRRIASLLGLVILLALADVKYGGPNGLHLGVEFVGGTTIPVELQHPINPSNFTELLQILQQRTNSFGLKQVTVEGLGNYAVYVTIPTASASEIASTISVIQSQGIFQGIVSGRLALNSSSLLSSSIAALQPTAQNGSVSWSVQFYLTQQAAQKFAKVVFGQADKPVYMFLDRPTGYILLMNSSILLNLQLNGLNESALLLTLQNATQLIPNQTIPIELYSKGNLNSALAFISANRNKYDGVIMENDAPQELVQNATALNYSVKYVSLRNMTPQVTASSTPQGLQVLLNAWPAIGLLSAPLLNPSITNGNISVSYVITGSAPSNLSQIAQSAYAINQSNQIVSILKGGALPVQVIVGTPYTVPPTLGSHFETISIFALGIAVLAVSIAIALRYKRLFLVLPIILTTLAELFIIMSIIGTVGTIDLPAVAGMIAVIGTGVDAQIIITDEVLFKGTEHTMSMRLGNAFYIIWADAALLIIAMLPLFFSTGLVDIIGFAESTILGVLFGALVTRPAYGAIISKHYAS